MSPAKVSHKEKVFEVPEGQEIHNVPEYDGLPLQAKLSIASVRIVGTLKGFIFHRDNLRPIEITETTEQPLPLHGLTRWERKDGTIILHLPEDVTIEPRPSEESKPPLHEY